jgi:phospholipid/cholesterol/gamma-HCH transport system substrate-binding protein
MESNKRKIILGLFILIGLVLFVVAVFVIGGKQNLFTPTFTLTADFETVSGLQRGSTVRFAGINVGTVDEIEVIGMNNVTVKMTIVSSVKPFIKKDSKVTVISEGLVGNKIVEITSGSLEAASVESGDKLGTIKPISTEDIFKNLKETGDNTVALTKDLSDIVAKVNQGQGTIGQLMTNDQLYRTVDHTVTGFSNSTDELNRAIRKISGNVDAISDDITRLTPRIRDITIDIAEISRKMNSSESIIGTLLTDTVFANNLKDVITNANKTTANLEKGAYSFSQNMEALKHNFLFKGYFEDIGYWDKADVEKKQDELKKKEEELNRREKELEEREKKMMEEK